MKWRHLGHFHLQLRAVAVIMAEMEVIPQEKVVNPQGMKVFAVERYGLPKDFVSFRARVQSLPFVFVSNWPIGWGPLHYSGRYRERLCASGLRSPELSA